MHDTNRRLCTYPLSMAALAISGLATGRTLAATAPQILETAGVKGGLIVHVGCGDGELTADLRVSKSYLVHGLDTDRAVIARAREHLRSRGLSGPVSVDLWDGKRLPYVDNLVNLLVVSKHEARVERDELMRVLAPGGVALVPRSSSLVPLRKPWPEAIDEWTHYLHDSANNAVAQDTVVGPPKHYQWHGSPRWSRHHESMASMSALVSAKGRLFYIFDEGPKASILLPPKWFLTARDAFNGAILWKRPIGEWHTHLWPLKSGPADLPRRLVAVGDRVYVTLAIDAPVSALDAATGETIRTYDETKGAQEIVVSDGTLFLSIDETREATAGSVRDIRKQQRARNE